MTCHVGENIVVCDGQSGWRVYPDHPCPWCLEKRRCIGTAIFSGWCGYDFICGTCGSYWSSEDGHVRKMSEQDRERYIARVAATPDPKCWECHDTGDTNISPLEYEPIFCQCAAGFSLRQQP